MPQIQVFNPTPVQGQAGQLGQALGGALGSYGGQKLLAIRQQSALADFKNALQPGDTPAEVSMKWANSMAGIPGAQQLQQSVLPQYQMQALVNMYNQQGQGASQMQPGQPEMQGGGMMPGQAQQAGAPVTPGMTQAVPAAGGMIPSAQGQAPVSGGIQQTVPAGGQPSQGAAQQQGAGLNPQLMMLSQMTGRPYEELLRAYSGVPQEQIGAELQNIQVQKSQQLANLANERVPGMNPEELNQFMRIGEKYQNMSPEDWLKSTKRDFAKYRNVKANFDNAYVPDIAGIFKGSKHREDALKRLEGLAEPLVALGDEDYVRNKLVNEGLSPAEAEMVIRPMSKSGIKEMKSLPKAPYQERDEFFSEMFVTPDKPSYEQLKESNPNLVDKMTDKYADYIAKNVSEKVSLLGLRERMRRETGIDYRQYQDAVNQAVANKGLELTGEQQGEFGELTNPPRDSLQWIFQDWGNWIDWLKGKK